jgi:hypothetical protein
LPVLRAALSPPLLSTPTGGVNNEVRVV